LTVVRDGSVRVVDPLSRMDERPRRAGPERIERVGAVDDDGRALTAGRVVPGVAAPQVRPGSGGAAPNGPVAASVVHTVVDHLLEGTGLSPATTDVTAERL
jgi:hypothetical protein